MKHSSAGFSLIELIVAMTIFSVLTSFGIPRFQRLMEQNRVDLAAVRLQSLWTAEKLYWASRRKFGQKEDLLSDGLLDKALANRLDSGTGGFRYGWRVSPNQGFQISAERTGSQVWSGTLTIDDGGVVSGGIKSTSGTVLQSH